MFLPFLCPHASHVEKISHAPYFALWCLTICFFLLFFAANSSHDPLLTMFETPKPCLPTQSKGNNRGLLNLLASVSCMANTGVDVVEHSPHINKSKLAGKLFISNSPFPGDSHHATLEKEVEFCQKLLFPVLINPKDKTTEIIDLFDCTGDEHRGKIFYFSNSCKPSMGDEGWKNGL